MKKRGQVSTFVIVGLIVLVVVGLGLFINLFVLQTGFDKQLETHADVPLEVKPITQYLDSCTSELATDALNSVGLHGGYVEVPYDPLPTTPFTPFDTSINLIQGSDLNVPFWFREKTNGVKVINVPSKNDVQLNIEKYINDNFQECVNGLDVYIKQGYNFDIVGVPQTQVELLDKQVNVVVNYPITVTIKDLNFPLKSHLALIENNFGEMYDVAKEIFNSLNDGLLLESKTLDTLVAYDDVVPFSGSSMDCKIKSWSKQKVEKSLRTILRDNIAALRVIGTDYVTLDEQDEYFELDVVQSSHKDLSVNFAYSPRWPLVMEVSPRTGDLLIEQNLALESGGAGANIINSLFCINEHHFVYDIKYPVVVTLTDKNGNLFNFAYEVIIDANEPRENFEEPLGVETDSPICEGPTKKMKVKTYTVSANNDLIDLPDVEVNLKCSIASCYMGRTSNNADLNADAPLCFNGILTGKKQGYYDGQSLVSTNEGDNDASIVLEPYYSKNVVVKVIEKETGEIRDPYDSEFITFVFTHKDADFSAHFIYYPKDVNDFSLEKGVDEKIDLIVGDYDVRSFIMGESTWPITVPQQTFEKCVDVPGKGIVGFFRSDEKCFSTQTESFQLDQGLKGGANFETSFIRGDLAGGDTLILYVLAEPLTSDMDKMALRFASLETNDESPNFRYPEII